MLKLCRAKRFPYTLLLFRAYFSQRNGIAKRYFATLVSEDVAKRAWRANFFLFFFNPAQDMKVTSDFLLGTKARHTSQSTVFTILLPKIPFATYLLSFKLPFDFVTRARFPAQNFARNASCRIENKMKPWTTEKCSASNLFSLQLEFIGRFTPFRARHVISVRKHQCNFTAHEASLMGFFFPLFFLCCAKLTVTHSGFLNWSKLFYLWADLLGSASFVIMLKKSDNMHTRANFISFRLRWSRIRDCSSNILWSIGKKCDMSFLA